MNIMGVKDKNQVGLAEIKQDLNIEKNIHFDIINHNSNNSMMSNSSKYDISYDPTELKHEGVFNTLPIQQNTPSFDCLINKSLFKEVTVDQENSDFGTNRNLDFLTYKDN